MKTIQHIVLLYAQNKERYLRAVAVTKRLHQIIATIVKVKSNEKEKYRNKGKNMTKSSTSTRINHPKCSYTEK